MRLKHWNFRNINSAQRAARKELYARVLEDALGAMRGAEPLHSGFRVGFSALNLSTFLFYQGNNFEYGGGYHLGSTHALHAESSGIDSVRKEIRPGDRFILATIGDASAPVAPCGHCLEILRTFFPMDTEILIANIRGEVEALTLENLFPSRFYKKAFWELSAEAQRLVVQAREAAQKGLLLHANLREGAAVQTSTGKVYIGARVDTASYHPTSSVASAIAAAIITGDPNLEWIALATQDGQVNGFDRQRIYEILDLVGQAETQNIFIASENERLIAVASAKELLPHGFSICIIGAEREIQGRLGVPLRA